MTRRRMYSLPLTQDEFQRSGYRDLIACKAQTKPVCLQVDSSLLRLVTSTDTQHSFRVVSRRSRVAAALVGLRRKNYLEVPSTSGRLPICTTVGKKEKKKKMSALHRAALAGARTRGRWMSGATGVKKNFFVEVRVVIPRERAPLSRSPAARALPCCCRRSTRSAPPRPAPHLRSTSLCRLDASTRAALCRSGTGRVVISTRSGPSLRRRSPPRSSS
jgi:hypothetical protein